MKRWTARWVYFRRIVKRPFYSIKNWLRTHTFPGLLDVPIWDVVVFFFGELKKDDPFMRANAVAFSFFLSLFPAIMTLFTLLPYLPIYENFNETIHSIVEGVMPGSAGEWLISFLEDIATRERTGLLSFSTLLFLFFSTSGTATLMYSFEKKYPEIFKYRNGLMIRWIAMWLTLLLALLVLASVALIIIGSWLITRMGYYFDLSQWITVALEAMRWILVILLFYSSITLLYRYGAPTQRKFRFFSTGATVATCLAIFSSIGFSMYINAFGTYNQLYGSIGTIIGLMLWLQINAFAIITGYELNTAIMYHRVTSSIARKKRSEVADKSGGYPAG